MGLRPQRVKGSCPAGRGLRDMEHFSRVRKPIVNRNGFGLQDPTVGYAMSRGSGAGPLAGEPAAVRLAATSMRTSVS